MQGEREEGEAIGSVEVVISFFMRDSSAFYSRIQSR